MHLPDLFVAVRCALKQHKIMPASRLCWVYIQHAMHT
jgi:hypothetical protein